MIVRLSKSFHFEAAHDLPTFPEGHKCRQMHGHSFKIEVSVEGEVDPKIGWFYDHADISKAMRPLLEDLDHGYLNEVPGLANPTIENMAAWFWQKLAPQCPGLAEIEVTLVSASGASRRIVAPVQLDRDQPALVHLEP